MFERGLAQPSLTLDFRALRNKRGCCNTIVTQRPSKGLHPPNTKGFEILGDFDRLEILATPHFGLKENQKENELWGGCTYPFLNLHTNWETDPKGLHSHKMKDLAKWARSFWLPFEPRKCTLTNRYAHVAVGQSSCFRRTPPQNTQINSKERETQFCQQRGNPGP